MTASSTACATSRRRGTTSSSAPATSNSHAAARCPVCPAAYAQQYALSPVTATIALLCVACWSMLGPMQQQNQITHWYRLRQSNKHVESFCCRMCLGMKGQRWLCVQAQGIEAIAPDLLATRPEYPLQVEMTPLPPNKRSKNAAGTAAAAAQPDAEQEDFIAL